jgi:branched-chain amino acid transport system substrate-binding protein
MSDGSYSRRDFLKIAGIAGATVGAAGGLGGLLAACGGTEESTTTTTGAASTTTTAAGPTTTAATAGSSTTVSTSAQAGREVKIGFVAPLTGSLASFGVPDQYCTDRATKAFGDAWQCGDGQAHKITILLRDSQSDSNRAAQVTGDLINNDKCDIIVAASTPDTTAPVSAQAEALETPCLTTDTPWESWVGAAGKGDLTAQFKWIYHVFWGAEDVAASMLDAWPKIPTNKVIATMFPNDADGNALKPLYTPLFQEGGYTVVDGGAFQDGTEDYTSQIAAFKKAGAEIGTGIFIPPDFTNFWKQAAQQGWVPKIATYTKALLFPQSVEALGAIANQLTTEVWWSPNHPFKSAFLNQTCQEFAADFEATQKQQWTQPLLHFLVFDWVSDVLTRTTSVDDKNAIVTAILGTNIQTIAGMVNFTEPVVTPAGPPFKLGPCRIAYNVYKSPLVLGQWRASTKYPLNDPGKGFDLVLVDNVTDPTVPVTDTIQPYTGT